MSFPPVLRYQIPVVLWILAIFTVSSIPRLPVIELPFSPDKIGHAGIYFVLCLLWRRALVHQERYPFLSAHALTAALLLTVVQGGVDELYQTTVPGRFADVYDFLADVTGGVLYAGWRKVRDRAVQETV